MLNFLFALFTMLFISDASAQQVAITIDDLPYVLRSRTTPQEGLNIVQKINTALAVQGATATGFAIGNQIDADTRAALNAFAAAGHQIGNHSWSHPDYSTLSKRAFRRETRKTDRALRDWLTDPKYYRFPYLKEGETEGAKQAADHVLTRFGYQNAPVTIDNDDWRFNVEYMDALAVGDTKAARRISADYLKHMRAQARHYREFAKKTQGRDVKHILLLHMNKINADHLTTLLAWFASSGWTFITLEEALSDPIYSMPDLYAGPRGISQLERIVAE